MTTAYLIAVHVLALVGLIAVLGGIGWLITAAGVDRRLDTSLDDALDGPTNVRVIDAADFTRGTVGTGGWTPNAPVTITHYAVGTDDAPGELRCWVCHKPCPSGVCNCTAADAS